MDPPPDFDEVAIAKLRKLGGVRLAGDMINLFLDYAPTKLAEGRAAAAVGDLCALGDAMHPLKTSASHVGARAVQALAQEIEQRARAQDPQAADPMARLEAAFTQVKDALREHREALR